MKRQNINVRSLAEFSMESGDLRAAMMMLDRMQDGMHGHKMLQGGYPAGYKSEVSVSLDVEVDGVPLRVVGRIDGLNLGGEPPLIDEIKTTQRDPSMIGEMDFPVHWAQAEIYAHIVCVQHQLPRAIVRLSYYNLNGSCQMFEHEHTAKELREIFLGYARPYAEWLKALAEWQGISLPTQSALAFPFAQYREGQRDMAANAYVAIREKKNLLVQAPTGIGKTAGALFPAIKALGEGQTSRIFYLTARTTTRAVAEQTIERMRQEGLRIRSLTLTAKEKMCLYPGERCSPDLCERARGYFDKRRAAIMEALGIERLTRDAIEQLAERHEVCPFELSLDLSEISDVVIGDYNHAFDPRVKLKRFFLDKGDYCLLIDEAHNLIDRSREMLSSSIDQRMFSALRRDLGRLLGKRHPLYACLTELIDAFNALREQYDQPTMEQEPPISLTEPLKQFAADVAPMVEGGSPALVDAYFAALGYLRACEMFDGSYRTLIEPSEKHITIKIWCYDASDYLRSCLDKVRSGIFFSATLAPMSYYRDQLGIWENEGDALLDLPSPFPPENLLVLRLPLATRYRMREQTASDLAQAILSMCRAKKGNYLACFPSHAYLNQIKQLLDLDGGVRILAQRSGMGDEERTHFLAQFVPNPDTSMLALIAMGGIFSEGIDLPGELLSGAAIVGVGIPQISFEREMLRQLYDDGMGEGYHYAYTYPGIERVLQAAGRVIRTDTDRGTVLLIDDRFEIEEYQALLPPNWQVHPARTPQKRDQLLASFWTGKI